MNVRSPATALPVTKNLLRSAARSISASRLASCQQPLPPPVSSSRPSDAMDVEPMPSTSQQQHHYHHHEAAAEPSTSSHDAAGRAASITPTNLPLHAPPPQPPSMPASSSLSRLTTAGSTTARAKTTPDAKRAQNRESAKRFRVAQKKRWAELNETLAEKDAEIERLKNLLQDVTNQSLTTMKMSSPSGPGGAAAAGGGGMSSRRLKNRGGKYDGDDDLDVDDDEDEDDNEGRQFHQQRHLRAVHDGEEGGDGDEENIDYDQQQYYRTQQQQQSTSRHKLSFRNSGSAAAAGTTTASGDKRNRILGVNSAAVAELELFTKLLQPSADPPDLGGGVLSSRKCAEIRHPMASDIGSLHRVLVSKLDGSVLGVRHLNGRNGAALGGDVGGVLWDHVHHSDCAHLRASVVHAKTMVGLMNGQPVVFSYRRRKRHGPQQQQKDSSKQGQGQEELGRRKQEREEEGESGEMKGGSGTGGGGAGNSSKRWDDDENKRGGDNRRDVTTTIGGGGGGDSGGGGGDGGVVSSSSAKGDEFIRMKGCLYPIYKGGDLNSVILAEFVEL